MKIEIKRVALRPHYTIGHMFINGVYFCDTLEDCVRKGSKIQNETAIPIGIYKVIVNYSERFKCIMPYILNVVNFSGIRIHTGNSDKDTSGCILVGKNTIVGKVTSSRLTFNKLNTLIKKEFKKGIDIQLIITQPSI